MADEREIAEDYRCSLADLTLNSKPLITMLTMLADENKGNAQVIVKVIEEHIKGVEPAHKLPSLYLIDSIIKNVGEEYKRLFAKSIADIFLSVFATVDERTRKKMYELRVTWKEHFPNSRLYYLDMKVQEHDPAWPIATPNIHVNPNVLRETSAASSNKEIQILRRQEQLFEIEKKKLDLERKKILQQHHEKTGQKIYVNPHRVGMNQVASMVSRDPRIVSDSSEEAVDSSRFKPAGPQYSKFPSEQPPSSQPSLRDPRQRIHDPLISKDTKSVSLPLSVSKPTDPRRIPPHQDLAKVMSSRDQKPSVGSHSRTQERTLIEPGMSVPSVAPSVSPPKDPRKNNRQFRLVPPEMTHIKEFPVSAPIQRNSVQPKDVRSVGLVKSIPKVPSSDVPEVPFKPERIFPSNDGLPKKELKIISKSVKDNKVLERTEKKHDSSAGVSKNGILSTKNDTQSSKSGTVPSKTDTLSTKNVTLPPKNDTLSSKNVTLSSKNDTLSSKNVTLSSKNDTLSSKNVTLSSKNDTLSSKNVTLSSKNDTLSSKNVTLASKNDNLLSKNVTLPSKNDTISSRSITIPSMNDTLSSKSTTVPSKNDTMSSKSITMPAKNGTASSKSIAVPSRNDTVPFKSITVPAKNDTVSSRTKEGKSEDRSRSKKEKSRSEEKPKRVHSESVSEKNKKRKKEAESGKATESGNKDKCTDSDSPVSDRTSTPKSFDKEYEGSDRRSTSPAKLRQETKKKSPNAEMSETYRSKNRSSKRREHIRKKGSSPQVIAPAPSAASAETSPSSVNRPVKGDSKVDQDQESDESDHYSANKPSPETYNKVDSAKESDSDDQKAEKTSSVSSTGDVDLRHFGMATNLSRSVPDEEGAAAEVREQDLFGTEDVDLRKLAHGPPPVMNAGVLQPPALPPAFQSLDQDLRKGTPAEGHFTDDSDASPEKISKSILFNSPHAVSWQKFRDKNPEFKEYQRQASVSDKEDLSKSLREVSELMDQHKLSDEPTVKDTEICQTDNECQASASSKEPSENPKNYETILSQAEEQYRRGEIKASQYNNLVEQVWSMMEKDKIKKAKERRESKHSESIEADDIPEAGPAETWKSQRSAKTEETYPGKARWLRPTDITSLRDSHRVTSTSPKDQSIISKDDDLMAKGSYVHQSMEDEWTDDPELPVFPEEVLRRVSRESETRSIEIDSIAREIRTYGGQAVMLYNWDDPRLISFETDYYCDIVFDGGKFVMPCRIGEDYKEFILDGKVHKIKLGVPTQEIFIDGRGYQCFFGGKPISVYLSGKTRSIWLNGNPPQVKISENRNLDYLAGKVQLIINARKRVSLYLDAKPQRFNIDGKQFVLKFIDSFRSVEINGKKFPVNFGGLPISIAVRQYRQYLSFSALPVGIIPGQLNIIGMEAAPTSLFPTYSDLPANKAPLRPPPAPPMFIGQAQDSRPQQEAMRPPAMKPHMSHASEVQMASMMQIPDKMQPQVMPPLMLQPINKPGSLAQGSMGPPLSIPSQQVHIGSAPLGPLGQMQHSVPPISVGPFGFPFPIAPCGMNLDLSGRATPGAYVSSRPSLPSRNVNTKKQSSEPVLNINALLDNLVKTGLISSKGNSQPSRPSQNRSSAKEDMEKLMLKEEKDDESVHFMKLFQSDYLRKRRYYVIDAIYRGIQCSSCGLRYSTEKTVQYSNHLDWHFRQNKKQQESVKKANARKFFLPTSDWLQYEEFEDEEERVPSMFETEGLESGPGTRGEPEESSVPVTLNDEASLGVCPVCHDTFSQFFHQETEEWHYRNAVQVDGLNYHPDCHRDDMKRQEALRKAEEEERLMKEQEAEEMRRKGKDMEVDEDNSNKAEKEKEEAEDVAEMETEATCSGEDKMVTVSEELLPGETEVSDQPSPTPADGQEARPDADAKGGDAEDTETDIPMETESSSMVPEDASLPSPFIHIKEEVIDPKIDETSFTPLFQLPSDIKIKVEVKEEPSESEPEVCDLLDETEMMDDGDITDSQICDDNWETPMAVNILHPVVASSIEGNVELMDDGSSHPSDIPRLKISLAQPVNSPKTNNVSNSEEKESTPEAQNGVLEEDETTFQAPPFTVDFTLKPAFRGVTLQELPVEKRGIEMSSLCSIM